MRETHNWQQRATTTFVLLLGLGVVSEAGYLSYQELVSPEGVTIADDLELIKREFGIDDNNTYAKSMMRVGNVASQCFLSAGGRGISRIVPVSGSDEMMVVFRSAGNESIDTKNVTKCINDLTDGQDVILRNSIAMYPSVDNTHHFWNIF